MHHSLTPIYMAHHRSSILPSDRTCGISARPLARFQRAECKWHYFLALFLAVFRFCISVKASRAASSCLTVRRLAWSDRLFLGVVAAR
jgi:hypothetical protein